MKGKIRTYIITLLLLIFTLPDFTHAWDNNNVHPELTTRALNLFLQTLEPTEREEFYKHAFHDGVGQCRFIDEGSVKEDMGFSPQKEAVSGSSWNLQEWGEERCSVDQFSLLSHAYNPITKKTWTGEDFYGPIVDDDEHYIHALDRAERIWLRDMIKTEDENLRYFTLGRLCHLLQDMTVPAHILGDFHGLGDDVEEYAEKYTKNIFAALDFKVRFGDELQQKFTLRIKRSTTDGLDEQFRNGNLNTRDNISSFMENVAYQTYYMVTYYGGKLKHDVGDEQPKSELKLMFPYNDGEGLRYRKGGGLRYDPGGHYRDAWIIDNIGAYWTRGGNNDWWECKDDSEDESKDDSGYYYLENIDGWRELFGGKAKVIPAQFKPEENSFERLTPQNFTSLEENEHKLTLEEIYVRRLFPFAIEWTAGLIQTLYEESEVVSETLFRPVKKSCKCRQSELIIGLDSGVPGMDPDNPTGGLRKNPKGESAPGWTVFGHKREWYEWRKSFATEDCTCYFEKGKLTHCDSRFAGLVAYCD